MTVDVLDKVLWAASVFGEAALLLVLLWRGCARIFPIFTVFVCFQSVRDVLLYAVLRYGGQNTYYNVYYSLTAVDYLLQMGLIFEIARDVLRPTGTWIRDARRPFLLWSALGVLIAGLLAALMPHGEASPYGLWEMRASVFASLLICEVFLAVISSANRMGLQWRSHVMALGQGLTVFALLTLAGDLADVATGWHRYNALIDHVRIIIYNAVLLFWVVSFWLPERKRAPLSADMQKYLVALHARLQYDLESVRSPGGTSL